MGNHQSKRAADCSRMSKTECSAFGQLTSEPQSHSGAVTTGTPKVQYGYTNGSANHARRTSITRPDNTAIDLDYGSSGSADDVLNRLKQLKSGSTVLVDYSYLGQGTPVIANYSSQPVVALTYLKQSGDSDLTGDRNPGDDYYGLDRFGRVQDSGPAECRPGLNLHVILLSYCQ
jgi:hypothetical protein